MIDVDTRPVPCLCGQPPVVDDLTRAPAGFAVVRCANLNCGRAANGPTVEVASYHWNRMTDCRLAGGTTTADYRLAPSGEGPLAGEWEDKPHRLIYDLCGEVERLSQKGNP